MKTILTVSRFAPLVVALAMLLAMTPTGVVHANASPQACSEYSSTSDTSAAGNAYAEVVTFTCPSGSSSGQITGEWYTCVPTPPNDCYGDVMTLTACGVVWGPDAISAFIYGKETYGSSGCNAWECDNTLSQCSGFPENTSESHSFPAESGATTTEVWVWNYGNNTPQCAVPGSTSTCEATTLDSAP
jgi:hypothetical protein